MPRKPKNQPRQKVDAPFDVAKVTAMLENLKDVSDLTRPSGNSRNGYSKKTLKTSQGPVEIEVPRDRDGSFDPLIVKKHQSFDSDLENRVTSMYARGMSARDIRSQLQDSYGTEVSQLLSQRSQTSF